MKKRSGCLNHILIIGMILGIIGAAGLGYLGYQKATTAEANATSIEELGNLYLQGETAEETTGTIEDFLTELLGDSDIVKDTIAVLKDDTIAEIITVHHYLPGDETVSTAIGQRILIHRLNKTYTKEELTSIYCNMMGYTATNLSQEEKDSFLQNILDDLTEQGFIFNDTGSDWEKTAE